MTRINNEAINENFDHPDCFPISCFFVNALQITLSKMEEAMESSDENTEDTIRDLEVMIEYYSNMLERSYELESINSKDFLQIV